MKEFLHGAGYGGVWPPAGVRGAGYHFFLPRVKASGLVWIVDEVAPETVFCFVFLGFLGSRFASFLTLAHLHAPSCKVAPLNGSLKYLR